MNSLVYTTSVIWSNHVDHHDSNSTCKHEITNKTTCNNPYLLRLHEWWTYFVHYYLDVIKCFMFHHYVKLKQELQLPERSFFIFLFFIWHSLPVPVTQPVLLYKSVLPICQIIDNNYKLNLPSNWILQLRKYGCHVLNIYHGKVYFWVDSLTFRKLKKSQTKLIHIQ